MIKLKNFNELIRLKQSSGTLLLILPCLFSIAQIYKTHSPIKDFQIIFTTILFIIGAFVMRSAGCIINDLIDINIDKKVSRTKNRPLASNQISIRSAILILTILLSLGFIILLQFNAKTIIAGFVAIILVTTYPFMKRITYFPQLFLGLTFNFGIIMSSLALIEEINFGTVVLYCATIAWTLLYDTIYGFQDIEDDLKIGIKSTAIAFSRATIFNKSPKIILYKIAIIMNLFLIMLGVYEDFEKNYFILIILNTLFIILKIMRCDLKNPQNCLSFFKLNMFFGINILIAIMVG